jgi:epoxide hydrolase
MGRVAGIPGPRPVDRAAEHRHGCPADGWQHLVHWSEFPRGGHFAAMEAPGLLIDDIRTFFRTLR